MQSAFGSYTATERKRLEQERIQNLMNLARALTMTPRRPAGLLDPGGFAPDTGVPNTSYTSVGGHPDPDRDSAFSYQQSNRNKDGTWDAPLADRDNIRGTSVDPEEPIWPRWRQTPPSREDGDFISDEPFYDIDEISGRVEFYPPGKVLRDANIDGNPARRQRVGDMPAGNSWRRRLQVAPGDGLPMREDDQDGGLVRVAQNPFGPDGRSYGPFPPPPDKPFVPDWLPPKPITIPFPDPFGGPTQWKAVPGWR